MRCGHLNPSPRRKQLGASPSLRLQSLSPQRHINESENGSPAASGRVLTDDEKPDEQTGKMEVDEL
jgi:hypothetical protein